MPELHDPTDCYSAPWYEGTEEESEGTAPQIFDRPGSRVVVELENDVMTELDDEYPFVLT